eukprot:CAMPEP_0119319616 /NCGR_PEP_ID=MMETSP1333-20130426/49877_1 /TAXON_ID=418940 /ORGANISM="Scyphosphaera apsteinii, Strain RCC1455" /LENGTH=458 /DNA_ID=CAMNT_0007326067 /DNA_START=83 /DNA_END=1459 /DNA_ORIENTATION=+
MSKRMPPSISARAGRIAAVATLSSPKSQMSEPVGYDAWAASLDYGLFREEIHELGQRLANQQGEADIRHLKKMIRWSNACGLVGMATMWMSGLGRLLPVVALSTWTCTRWTMIGHHICHGGYNRQDNPRSGGSGRYTTHGFAVGSVFRRCRDWFDWMLPEAWNVEHNNLHHYRLGEGGDPDLVERNLELLRTLRLPRALKYVAVAGLAAMWKWYYYAPNTYKQLKLSQMRKAGVVFSEEEAHAPFTLPVALFDSKESAKFRTGPVDFMSRVMGPYLLLRFFALPLPLLLVNRAFYTAAVVNLFLADTLSNIHSFIIIATNHCGDDMYKFGASVTPRSGSFYMRAVTSSVNFRTANGVGKPVHGNMADLNDFLHGWLNYQIEHHAYPQLSMLSYQKAAPQFRAICEKHAVPYVQQNVFHRLKKTADVMVGHKSMRQFDDAWVNSKDLFQWDDQKTHVSQ